MRHRRLGLTASEIKLPDHAGDRTPIEHRSRADGRRPSEHRADHLTQRPAPGRVAGRGPIGAARGAPGPRAIALAAAIMAGSMVVTAVAPTVPTVLAWSLILISVIAVLQSADPRMLGRVMSLFAVVLLGGNSAGGPIAATLATSIGPRAPFILGAAALAAIAITTSHPHRPSKW